MGDEQNDIFTEIPFVVEDKRDLAFESGYEYGSRAGIWRPFRVFDAAGIPVTFFATAVALERNPAVAHRLAERHDEAAAHGYRWSNAFEMEREEERRAIQLADASLTATVGERSVGWYHREMSVNTRELVVEHGGFLYDSECYNDDLPYWTPVHGQAHSVGPLHPGCQRRSLRGGPGVRQSRAFLRAGQSHSRPAPPRRRRRQPDDVDRAAPPGDRPPRARRRARPLHRLCASYGGRVVRQARRHRPYLRLPGSTPRAPAPTARAGRTDSRLSTSVSSFRPLRGMP